MKKENIKQTRYTICSVQYENNIRTKLIIWLLGGSALNFSDVFNIDRIEVRK